MQCKFIDFHNHSQNAYSEEIIALPTYRVGVEAIAPYIPFLWLGLHPWDSENTTEFEQEFEQHQSKMIGIGEIGLDFYYNSENIQTQKEVFVKQLKYAQSHNKPVTIHCVRAYNALLTLLREHKPTIPVILHSFVGSSQMANDFAQILCYISFSPMSFTSPKTIEVMKNYPLDKIFLETDDNQTSIINLYERFAEIRAISIEELKEQIYNNFKTVLPQCQIG